MINNFHDKPRNLTRSTALRGSADYVGVSAQCSCMTLKVPRFIKECDISKPYQARNK